MPQDRRSPPSATQDTNQPPIVRPHSATLSLSAFLVGCCDRSSSPPSQRRNPTAAAAILHTCGRPAVRSARIRTQRVDHPPRDRGSTPRRARAVDPRPYYWPLARPQADHPPPALTTRAAVCSFVRGSNLFASHVGPIPPTSGRLAVRPGRRQPTTPQLSTTPPASRPPPPRRISTHPSRPPPALQPGHGPAADIGYTRTHPPGYHHHHHHQAGGPHSPTHPLPPPYVLGNRVQIFSSEFLPENCARFSGLAPRLLPLPPYPLAFRRIRWPGIPQLASAGIWRRAER